MARSKSSFKYRGGERTVESMQRRAKEGTRDYDNIISSEVRTYKPKEGECCVRILPPTWEDMDKWGDGWDIVVYVHYNVGPDNASYLCLEKNQGERCPVCEARASSTDPDEADQLTPTKRALAWVIDRDNEKTGPQIWSMPFTKIRNEIYARSIDKKRNTPILIDQPEDGFDIVFNRAGTDQRTQYTAVEVMRDATPLHDDPDIAQKWLEYVEDHPIPASLNFYDADHIERILFGQSERRRPRQEEESPRTSQRSRRRLSDDEDEGSTPRQARRARVVDEDEEETPRHSRSRRKEDDEEEVPSRAGARRRLSRLDKEEIEEEETPRRRSRQTAVEEEEDPDEDIPFDEEEEEEEEEKPARPQRRPRASVDKEDEDSDSDEEDNPSASARRSVERLRRRRAREDD